MDIVNIVSEFSLPNGEYGKNFVIFEVDNSFYVHADNRKKKTLVLRESQIQISEKNRRD